MGSPKAHQLEQDEIAAARLQKHNSNSKSELVAGQRKLKETVHSGLGEAGRTTDNLQLFYKLKDIKMKKLHVPHVADG